MELKTDLGIALKWSNHERVREGMLTLREMDELLRRGGMEAGLVPQSEFPVHVHGYEKAKRIDWVWRLPGDDDRIIAAFEIDGLSVNGPNAKKALLTLGTLDPPLKYLLLFQIDHDFSWKGDKGRVVRDRSTEVDKRKGRFKQARIFIRRDVDLMTGAMRAMQEIVDRARTVAKGITDGVE